VLLSGMVAGVPHQGGATWAILQYLLGLRALGHDVFVLEVVDRRPDRRVGRAFDSLVEEWELAGCASLLVAHTTCTSGASYDDAVRFARGADLLINVSGMLRDERLLDLVPCRLYLDLDPAFTQLWASCEAVDMGLDLHTHFATVGARIGGGSPVPTCGRQWLTTLPPVALDHWPATRTVRCDAYTTVANWRSYGTIEHAGTRYGQKAHSFRELVDLPVRAGERFLLALDIHPDERSDLDALSRHGWRRTDPVLVAGTPSRYRAFVQGSRGELGVAKHGYVVSRCGWFSDRSACYLASGRPVIAQDTGFTQVLPTGEGLFAFSGVDDVVEALAIVDADYEHHAAAARLIAEDHLAADRVMTSLLERL
jgi:hypothetical protein